MTDEEHETLARLREEWWLAFSKLTNETIAKVPAHLKDELEAMLGDASSVYGRKT
jgi:hypothetical protein